MSAENEPTAPSKLERVAHIARLMASGMWRTRVTELELMAAWGVSIHLVRRDAEEASRLLKFDQKELDMLREQQRAMLERIQHDALERKNTVTGLPDYKSALEATKMTYEYVLGVGKRDTEKDPATLDDEELKRLAVVAAKVLAPPEAEKSDEAPVQDQGPTGG